MVYGLVLTLFGTAILLTAPAVLDRAEAMGFSPRLVQQAWRAAVAGALTSFALAVPVFTTDLWTAPARLLGVPPLHLGVDPLPVTAQTSVAAIALVTAAWGWHRGRPALADYRRALRVQLDRLESCAPLLDEEEPGRPRLVIVEDTGARLNLLPSRPPRVEVTTGALDRLLPEELNAVLTHMSGHLRRRDARWMLTAEVLAEAFPYVGFFGRWADRAASLAEQAADGGVKGGIGRANLRAAIVKLSGPGQPNGPFCPCFAWPQQRQEELTVPRDVRRRPSVAVDAGLRTLTAAAVIVPAAVALSPHVFLL